MGATENKTALHADHGEGFCKRNRLKTREVKNSKFDRRAGTAEDKAFPEAERGDLSRDQIHHRGLGFKPTKSCEKTWKRSKAMEIWA
jgi:hypothetical protein